MSLLAVRMKREIWVMHLSLDSQASFRAQRLSQCLLLSGVRKYWRNTWLDEDLYDGVLLLCGRETFLVFSLGGINPRSSSRKDDDKNVCLMVTLWCLMAFREHFVLPAGLDIKSSRVILPKIWAHSSCVHSLLPSLIHWAVTAFPPRAGHFVRHRDMMSNEPGLSCLHGA